MKNKCYDFSKLSGKPVSYVNKDDFMNLGTFLINSNFKNTPCYTLDEGNPEHFFARLGSEVRKIGILPGQEFRKFSRLGSQEVFQVQEICQVRKFAMLESQEFCQVRNFESLPGQEVFQVQEICQVKKLLSQEVSFRLD